MNTRLRIARYGRLAIFVSMVALAAGCARPGDTRSGAVSADVSGAAVSTAASSTPMPSGPSFTVDGPPDVSAGASVVSASGARLLPTADLLAIPSLDDRIIAMGTAKRQLLQRCLRARGVSAVPEWIARGTPEEQIAEAGAGGFWVWNQPPGFPNGIRVSPTPQLAREFGYGIITTIDRNPSSTTGAAGGKVPGDPFFRQPAAVQQQFLTAYDGSHDDGSPTTVALSATCLGAAQDQLGITKEPLTASVKSTLAGFLAPSAKAPAVSAQWSQAVQEWTGCMGSAGYPGLDGPDASAAVQAMASAGEPVAVSVPWAPKDLVYQDPGRALAIEKAVATADSACAVSTGLDRAHAEELTAWRTQKLMDDTSARDDLARYLQWWSGADAKIKQALAGS